MLVVVRLNVGMLGVVMLNVVAPVKEIEDINDRNWQLCFTWQCCND